MKLSKKLVLRILAGVGGALIIAGVAFFINSQVGNPLSEFTAKSRVMEYINQNFSGMGLYIEHLYYYNGGYQAQVQSQDNVDVSFTVNYYPEFKNLSDDYKDRVPTGLNTECRWMTEYTNKILPIFKAEFPELDASADLYIDESNPPSPGADFDLSLVKETGLSLIIKSPDLSPKNAADILTKVNTFAKSKGYNFTKYTLAFWDGVMSGGVHAVTSQMIESGELQNLLTQAEKDHYAFRDGPVYDPMRDGSQP